MFPLHDRTRRQLTNLLFLLLAVAPTLATVGLCMVRRLPSHARQAAEAIGLRLGLKATLATVRYPQPGSAVYEGLELADPATGQVVLRCRRAEARRQTLADSEKQAREFLVLSVSGVEIEPPGGSELSQLVERALAGRLSDGCLRIKAEDPVSLKTAGGMFALAEVEGHIESLARGTWVGVAFRPADRADGGRAAICLTRDRRSSAPVLCLDIDTGGHALPCSLLAPNGGLLAGLGPEATFQGILQADRTADCWSGQISAEIAGIDLATVLAPIAPGQLSGRGRLTLETARFRAGRLEMARGALAAENGTIGPELVATASRGLGLQTAASPREPQPYRQLGFGFQIEGGRIEVQGRCPVGNSQPAAVAVGPAGPILGPQDRPQPIATLAESLVPAGSPAAALLAYFPDAAPSVAARDAQSVQKR